MTHIYIEPVNIRSIRSAMKIVNLLRSDREVARQSIITISIDGFGDHVVVATPSTDAVHSSICAILNGNQDKYNFYNEDWPAPSL